MRIVLNTRSDDAGSRVCIYDLADRLRDAGIDATVNDWSGYTAYDVAIFMGYDQELDAARASNPDIRVVLADPKLSRPEWVEAARRADLLLVSSIEQRDVFLQLNRNVHVFLMLPRLADARKVHEDRKPVVIGYHGNRVHLEAMVAGARPALEELSLRRSIEFRAVYDVKRLGRASVGMPDAPALAVRHIQWTPSFDESLLEMDIGIVPNELPIRDRLRALRETAYPEPELMYEPFDYLIRFKASTNAGRIYPFAHLGIPVVADFAPSAAQMIEDGRSGFLVSSANGWYDALDTLVGSADLRREQGERLRDRAHDLYDRQVGDLLAACVAPVRGAPLDLGDSSLDDRRALLTHFARPRGSLRARVWRRLTR